MDYYFRPAQIDVVAVVDTHKMELGHLSDEAFFDASYNMSDDNKVIYF
jgi:hypothetical protein